MPENDEKTIGKIKESLDFLDSSLEVKKPDLMNLVKLVNETEERKEQEGNRQFVAFLMSAILIVAFETFAFTRSFAVFVTMQAAALVFILPVMVKKYKKRRQVYEK